MALDAAVRNSSPPSCRGKSRVATRRNVSKIGQQQSAPRRSTSRAAPARDRANSTFVPRVRKSRVSYGQARPYGQLVGRVLARDSVDSRAGSMDAASTDQSRLAWHTQYARTPRGTQGVRRARAKLATQRRLWQTPIPFNNGNTASSGTSARAALNHDTFSLSESARMNINLSPRAFLWRCSRPLLHLDMPHPSALRLIPHPHPSSTDLQDTLLPFSKNSEEK